MKYVIVLCLVFSGCATMRVAERGKDDVTLCGRHMDPEDFRAAARRACGTQVSWVKSFQNREIAKVNQYGNAVYRTEQCLVFQCDSQ